MSVSLAILILYIIALFGISWFAKKRSEGNAENYALAGRRLSAPLIAVTIIGLAVGGASTIGVSEHAFRVGLSAGWYTIAWAIGAIVMGIFMAKKYREQNITTISELIERHHGTNAVILGVFCQIGDLFGEQITFIPENCNSFNFFHFAKHRKLSNVKNIECTTLEAGCLQCDTISAENILLTDGCVVNHIQCDGTLSYDSTCQIGTVEGNCAQKLLS